MRDTRGMTLLQPYCPSCKTREVRASKNPTLLSRVLRLGGVRKMRCRACGRGFYAFLPVLPPDTGQKR